MDIEHITELPSPPARPENAHKGTFGRVLIIGGSRGMSGAVCLAGLGALRGGAGLVHLAVPAGILPIVASVEPSYLTIPLPEDDEGRLSRQAQTKLAAVIPNKSALAMGPGWGESDDLVALANWLYTTARRPMVIDADGLNALARQPGILSQGPAPRILTPHPGEFARLTRTDTATVQQDREELAAKFAQENDIVLVLKGHRTVVTDGERLAVNTTGNSGLATGGTGDVLTGLIAALLGQGMPPFEAAQFAAYLHGLAGDMAAEELSSAGLIASDLPRYVAKAWTRLSGESGSPVRW